MLERNLVEMHSRRVLVVLSLVVVIATALGVTAASSSATAHGLSERAIKRIALKAARQAGDRHPTLIQHVAGRREEANKIDSGDVVPGNTWCYLVAVRGRFVLTDVSTPPGAKAPTGTVLTLIINAKTGAGLDLGLSDHYPDLRKLGPVTTDLRN